MQYQITWHNANKDILLVKIADALPWENLDQLASQCFEQIMIVSHRVDVIVVIQDVDDAMSVNGFADELSKAARRRPSNYGMCVVVNPPATVRVTLQVFMQKTGSFLKRPFQFADTIADADHIIKRVRKHRIEASVSAG